MIENESFTENSKYLLKYPASEENVRIKPIIKVGYGS